LPDGVADKVEEIAVTTFQHMIFASEVKCFLRFFKLLTRKEIHLQETAVGLNFYLSPL
jgi:hypothetical protein